MLNKLFWNMVSRDWIGMRSFPKRVMPVAPWW